MRNSQEIYSDALFWFTFRPGGKATFDAEALTIKAQMAHKEVPKSNGHQVDFASPYVMWIVLFHILKLTQARSQIRTIFNYKKH